MTSGPLVTILINNYNYGRFLTDAIDSALIQTYRKLEVILKENGGQASAFNAGFAASQGEIICLLDADDYFDRCKVERVVPHCRPGSMLYHTLRLAPGTGVFPARVGPPNSYRFAQQYRFVPYVGSPSSGLVIGRELALRLMPLPTQYVRSCADDFIVRGSALVGEVIGIPDVLGNYRVHGGNAWYGKSVPKSHEFMEQLEKYLNQKLVEAGKAPVIDFYRSLFAEDFVPQNPAGLARLAFSVLSHHFNFFTLKFTLRTLAQAGRRAITPI
jgi:glycosyltransferase involved in cell wall biosynthesis